MEHRRKEIILLVDDDRHLLVGLGDYLRMQGYAIVTAASGESALARLEETIPDLIILDLMLPKIDGYKVCMLLKKDTRFSQIPIIIFTAKAQQKDIELGQQIGADAYIIKPFEPQTLLDKIKELLAKGGWKATGS